MSKEKLEALKALDITLRQMEEMQGEMMFSGEFFPRRLSQGLSAFIEEGGELGSRVPERFFRDAVQKYPEKGLAWFGFSTSLMALQSTSSEEKEEAALALAKAMELGCGYCVPTEGGVGIRMIGNEPPEAG